MKITKYLILMLAVTASLTFSVNQAFANLIPSLSISPIVGGTTAQVTVYGADSNASVLLDYPSVSSVASANIGTTNASGYFTGVIDATTYSIAPGASVYAMVNGQVSPSTAWPSYSGSGNLTLSQTTIILSVGQNTTIYASVSAPLSMTNNTNPSVASVTINGSQLTVNAFSAGSSNITICASGLGCNTIAVSVQATGSSAAAITLSQNNISLSAGQSQTVTVTGTGPYYINSNSNSAIAVATISGSTVTIGAVNAGADAISICSTGNNSTICGSLNVTVTQGSNNNQNINTQTSLTFGQSNVNLLVGQSQTVTISNGVGGVYYISTNSNSSAVTANISGTSVVLTGIAFGGANITVCTVSNQCGNLYAFVSNTNGTSTNTTVAPTLSSFQVSSTDSGGDFIGTGSTLTFVFNTNQSINTPRVTLGTSNLSVTGNGTGPYTARYTLNGNESLPLQVTVVYSNPAGSQSQNIFWLGKSGTIGSSNISQSSSVTTSTSLMFTQNLHDGSKGVEVVNLQKRLTTDGIYNGPITGTYGPLTKVAVKTYQAKHGIDQLGTIGPATRAMLNKGI